MTDKPIDFEAARERRDHADIITDEKHWNDVRALLYDILVTSEMSDRAITSATLRALLDVLMVKDGGEELEIAKENIKRSLNAFFTTFVPDRRNPK